MKTPSEKLAAALDARAARPDADIVLTQWVDGTLRALTVGDLRAVHAELAALRADWAELRAATTEVLAGIVPGNDYREGRRDGVNAVLIRMDAIERRRLNPPADTTGDPS